MKRLLFNEVEVCELLSIKPGTLVTMKFPKVMVGRNTMYFIDDIIQIIKKSARNGAVVPDFSSITYSDDEQINGIGELAIALGLPYRYVFFIVKSGQIPFTKNKKDYTFLVKDVKNWIRERKMAKKSKSKKDGISTSSLQDR